MILIVFFNLTDCVIYSAWYCWCTRFGRVKYFEVTQEIKRFVKWITEYMNAAMNAKRVKLDFSLAKHLSIADPNLGHSFLAQIKWHYDLWYKKFQMNRQKFQHLDTSKIDPAQKVKWLELWNSTPVFCMSLKFSKISISDKAFNLWLHKEIFWSHVQKSRCVCFYLNNCNNFSLFNIFTYIYFSTVG